MLRHIWIGIVLKLGKHMNVLKLWLLETQPTIMNEGHQALQGCGKAFDTKSMNQLTVMFFLWHRSRLFGRTFVKALEGQNSLKSGLVQNTQIMQKEIGNFTLNSKKSLKVNLRMNGLNLAKRKIHP